MVDHDNLGESASIGVTVVILILVTAMTMQTMLQYIRNPKYPQAQKFLYCIFLMPLLIGWISWVELFQIEKARSLTYALNLFKAVCLASFFLYIEKMLGWVQYNGENTYREEQKYEVLSQNGKKRFLCLNLKPITTKSEAESYLTKIRACVLQFSVVVLLIGIIAGIMIVSTDNYTFTDRTQNKVFQ